MGTRIVAMVRRALARIRFRIALANLRKEEAERQERIRREEAEQQARLEQEQREAAKAAEERKAWLKQLEATKAEDERLRKQAEERERLLKQRRSARHAEKSVQAQRIAASLVPMIVRDAVAKAIAHAAAQAGKEVEEQDESDVVDKTHKVRTFRNASLRSSMNRVNTGHMALSGDFDVDQHPANLVMMVDELTFNSFALNLGTLKDVPQDALVLCRYKNILPSPLSRVELDPVYDGNSQVRMNHWTSFFLYSIFLSSSTSLRGYLSLFLF